MQSYSIVLVCSWDYVDRLGFCINHMVASDAERILIYTEKGTQIPFKHPKIEVVPLFDQRTTYAQACARKVDATIHALGRCTRVVQLDADVLVVGQLGDVFDMDFDIGIPTFVGDCHRFNIEVPMAKQHAGYPGGAIWIRNTPLAIEFLQAWHERQKWMTEHNHSSSMVSVTGIAYAHDCVAMTDLLNTPQRWTETKLVALNYLVFNSFPLMNRFHYRAKWLEWVSKLVKIGRRPRILHFPSNTWRDREWVEMALNALTEATGA